MIITKWKNPNKADCFSTVKYLLFQVFALLRFPNWDLDPSKYKKNPIFAIFKTSLPDTGIIPLGSVVDKFSV